MSRDARLLQEVCVLMLVYGEPGPELAAWCLRMLIEPGAAERAIMMACLASRSNRIRRVKEGQERWRRGEGSTPADTVE